MMVSMMAGAAVSARADVTAPGPPNAGGAELGANELWTRLERDGRVVLYKITFETAKPKLRPDAEPTLAEIARMLAAHAVPVRVEVHSDSMGAAEYNLTLSRARANAIRDWLAAHGAAAARLTAEGYGEDRPIVDNRTAEGRAKNRRVELVLVK
jgi:OmpA-OmpF porin, OOP family